MIKTYMVKHRNQNKTLALVASLSALVSSASTFAMDLSWNGFGSVYMGKALMSDLLPSQFTSTKVDFTRFSLMGLNLAGKINDNFSFASQLIALGSPLDNSDAYGLIAQWAYANYTPGDGFSFKVGRQLFPIYMASEYVRVGLLLPFRQIPAAMGLAPITRFDGVSAAKTIDVGVGELSVHIFGGTPLVDSATSAIYAFTLNDLLGAQATLDGDGWRIRAQASRNYTKITSTVFGNGDGHSQNYSAGYRFDKYNIVSWGEYALVSTPDGTMMSNLTPTGKGNYAGIAHMFYILAGYRIGNFMPRYTYSSADCNYGFLIGSQVSHTMGINYQAGDHVVIKSEYEITVLPQAGGGAVVAQQPAGTTVTSSGALYAGVDFIF